MRARRPILGGRVARGARRAAVSILLAVVGLLVAGQAGAHNLGQSYLYLQIYEDRLAGRFEIALSDLNPALSLAGTELEITAENLDRRIGFLADYYLDHVSISTADGPLSIQWKKHDLLAARGGFVLLPFELGGFERMPETLTIEYSVLLDEDPHHRGFLLVEHNWATGTFANENQVSLIFGPGSRRQEFDLTSSGWLRGSLALGRLGAGHMLKGLDHLFFLVALLLTAVLRREKRRWEVLEKAKAALWNAIRIVTALLAAHIVTLGMAALGLPFPPVALVETAIAVSILLAAADMLFPLFGSRVWWIVFVLGLFHGFGFARTLVELGALAGHRLLSLLAFVIGIEVGVLIAVAVVLPVLLLLRRSSAYARFLLPVAALCLILLSSAWTLERAFGIDIPLRELLPAKVQEVMP